MSTPTDKAKQYFLDAAAEAQSGKSSASVRDFDKSMKPAPLSQAQSAQVAILGSLASLAQGLHELSVAQRATYMLLELNRKPSK